MSAENCVWNTWEAWGSCSLTCGSGVQSRQRSKEGPRHGGQECDGEPTEDQDCNTQACPGNDKQNKMVLKVSPL